MLHEEAKNKIVFEIGEIDKLIESYSALLDYVKVQKPGLIEMTAMATVLHSFYNGIEKIFSVIGKQIDEDMPMGTKWHRDLLIQMNKPTSLREWKVSDELMGKLNEYLGFRHFYRHAYSFQLSWEKLEGLSKNMTLVWEILKEELNELLICD